MGIRLNFNAINGGRRGTHREFNESKIIIDIAPGTSPGRSPEGFGPSGPVYEARRPTASGMGRPRGAGIRARGEHIKDMSYISSRA